MSSLGNLVRLQPLHISELPPHPELETLVTASKSEQSETNTTTNGSIERPTLRAFITEALNEAQAFVDTIPTTFKSKGEKSSPGSSAKVELFTRDISPREISEIPWLNPKTPRHSSGRAAQKPAETWFARRSRHANQSEEGTATYSEFDEAHRVDHSQHEMESQPDEVYDAYNVLSWNEQIQAAVAEGGEFDSGYQDVTMEIYEMAHRIPFPLQPRIFPVLILIAKTAPHALLVLQIALDISPLPTSFYSNGRNLTEGGSALKRKKPVIASYTSTERIRMMPEGDVEWVMATTSDARGNLPMWVQKLGVPGPVVKDVGLFMRWVGGRRGRRSGAS